MTLPKPNRALDWRASAAALVAIATLSGCATNNPRDPLEPFNRTMFKFNDAIDQAALKPVATGYKKVVPSFVQTGVNNFFGNLADVWTGANNLMQGKGEKGMSDWTRVALNSTFGIGGLFDIASEAGLKKHNEDFGQTLGYWGVPSGPYLMLPLLGPSTVRDTSGLPVDMAANAWSYVDPTATRNVGTALRVIDARANVLDASNLMEEAALDRYEFIRDGYLQRRQGQVFDGEASRKALKAASDEPADAKSIRAAYADDAPATVPATASATVPATAPATAPAGAAPAATPTAPAPAPGDAPAAPAVSSETPSK
ncbi:MlaA family lipoprotein [Massilia antarctica]|uniref:MlaA family lipoprotein n=1 Tax=Massilia antarctica TaxID=2765360 RepID=UPI00226E45C4|nr:VacJ family lipoprotein [Massilia sp. H27-R4]MCY0915823.1 VacJ family lipoprotein [Massilia sp. H27-R4]